MRLWSRSTSLDCPRKHYLRYGVSSLPGLPKNTRKRGKVRRRVNERGRCNLRFAIQNLGRVNARTEGDTACDEEKHRDGRHVKRDLGDAGSVRAARHATVPAADVGGGSRRAARAVSL